MLAEIIRSLGGNPEAELIQRMFTQPHRTIYDASTDKLTILSQTLKELLHREVTQAQKANYSFNSV